MRILPKTSRDFVARFFLSLTSLAFSMALFLPQARAINIPKNLSFHDLSDVTQILGHNTATKFLSNPYALGGHSGFELGLSTEFIDTTDLSDLGAGTGKQSSFQYNRITIGKGLYDDFDVFVHFVPFSNSNEISEYGALMKWMFYQAKSLPLSFSAVAHYNTIDIQDTFDNEILGWDLMGGINLNHFGLYWGGGGQKARSSFSNKILNTSDPQIQLSSSSNTFITRSLQSHTFVGLQIELSSIFIAAEIDRYEQPVYSAKIGVRF